jgi:hypothetical protein
VKDAATGGSTRETPALTRSQGARQTPGNISIKVVFDFNKGCLSFNKGCFSKTYTIKRK